MQVLLCRLLPRQRDTGVPADRPQSRGRWKPSLCKSCPVPDILRQNACPNMALEARVNKTLLGLREEVKVYSVCSKHLIEVNEPAVGCGHCHEEVRELFEKA